MNLLIDTHALIWFITDNEKLPLKTKQIIENRENSCYVSIATYWVIGADYNFSDGSYINLQYLHGFFHERGNDNMNDYFFLRYEKTVLNNKLKIAPIGGGFIVTDWDNIKHNYALVYMPEIAYKATDNAEITISTVIFDGKGNNLFANLKDYNMVMFKLKYSF